MNKYRKIFPILYFVLLSSCSTSSKNSSNLVLLKTSLGNITVHLYDETPVHRDNFLKLVRAHVYDGVSFHRVIKDFMIQSGDPETISGYLKTKNDTLGTYTIPAEFNQSFFHKKGALAAAREGNNINPELRSSGTQFYIVQGVKYTDEMLLQAEQQIQNNRKQALFISLLKHLSDSNALSGGQLSDAEIQEKASIRFFENLSSENDYKIPENQRMIYKNSGGVPRLDGIYTVFGEVVDGLDVVDRIAAVKTNEKDKPITDVLIIKALVVSK